MQATAMLQQAVLTRPDGLGTVFGDRRRTWREIGDRVARLAGALQALGVGPGDRVAALAMNSDRFLELFYAIPWAGAVFAPLNIRWSVDENAFAMRDSGSTVLLVDDDFLDQAAALQELVPGACTLVHMGNGPTPDGMLSYEDLVGGHDPVPDAERRGDDPYVVLAEHQRRSNGHASLSRTAHRKQTHDTRHKDATEWGVRSTGKLITMGKQASPGFSSLGRNRSLRGTVIVRWRLAYQARSWRVTW